MTTQFNIQPIQGIINSSVFTKAVTNTAPNPVFFASANPSAIFKNIVYIRRKITNARIKNPINTGKGFAENQLIISFQI
ncbi:MAG: hypothetical protein BAJALOKI2v1_180025 [Promethearchaeota archaeon]|nr:MAG: hypothetical protein BAJALOKI2v1_180025 [Candidatus Lokiarchaeota archaeon]